MTKILEECKKAVEKEIREDCREEAMKILELGDKKDRQEFLKYHKENKGNICCLVLDFAKKKLVEAGKIEQKETDFFKDPNEWLNENSEKSK
jgi:hypothetical protein